MGSSHNGNDYERLKEELRRLKRRGAPWYFESELHQRLHGRPKRRPRLRPISFSPVLALAFLTLCILGIALYAVFMHTNIRFGVTPPAAPADTSARPSVPDTVTAHSAPAQPAGRRPLPAAERTAPPGRPHPESLTERPPRIQHAASDTGNVKRDTSGVRRDTSSGAVDTTQIPGAGGSPR